MNDSVQTNDEISIGVTNDDVNEKESSNEQNDESISCFAGSEEQIFNNAENENEYIHNVI